PGCDRTAITVGTAALFRCGARVANAAASVGAADAIDAMAARALGAYRAGHALAKHLEALGAREGPVSVFASEHDELVSCDGAPIEGAAILEAAATRKGLCERVVYLDLMQVRSQRDVSAVSPDDDGVAVRQEVHRVPLTTDHEIGPWRPNIES